MTLNIRLVGQRVREAMRLKGFKPQLLLIATDGEPNADHPKLRGCV